ncbi:cytochrome P450 18a1 [Neodiprion pinetum]|uniref:cytochrome P450 18a1 n=1 Tax=Neodiprion fabricii TaxID=2872261 RepID=UPI00076FDCD1|nr:cytochrome P450 18a1 [Neodiprion fabricii]XP_046478167.1 cytochrome P450 18a1 [Neodiprion pinetum]XP_046615553.1 cytochrome P450 18a1 [Neodiprion virginianus]
MLVEYAVKWAWRVLGGSPENVMFTLIVFVGVFAIVRSAQWLEFTRSLPPGPWGLPVVGYLPFLKGDIHLHFGQLAKKYGSMFSARLGSQLVVVLSDYRAIRDTFRREEFNGRPHNEFMNILGGYGIVNSEGAMWKEQRRFLHDNLRSLGMTYLGAGKKTMESKIMREVQSFLRLLSVQQGAPTNISTSLGMSISNVICSIIMGVRFHHGDSRFKRFMILIEEGFRLFGSMVAVNFIPVIRFLPGIQKIRDKIRENRSEMATFFQETVDQHRATFDEGNIRDLVDAYLLEIQKAKSEGRDAQLFQGMNHDRQMQQILGDLFSAGMETIKTTLEWAVVLMLHHPEAIRAVQEELDHVVGRSRLPALEDVPFLPITESTILEILRRSSIVPLGTTHATTRDVRLNGFTIPAGTQIVPLLHAVHMDPELWNEPQAFRPERFLSAEGKVTKPEYFIPFGVGRRMCLGDVLARMELFLFFSSLLHTFDISLPEGASLPSLRGNAGITVTPDPFKVCLNQRTFEGIDLESLEWATGSLRNVGGH